MTDNADILAARAKAKLANQANETAPAPKWSDTAPSYDPRTPHTSHCSGTGRGSRTGSRRRGSRSEQRSVAG